MWLFDFGTIGFGQLRKHPRRRTAHPTWQLVGMRGECLESRQLLSAVSVAEDAPVACEVANESQPAVEKVPHHGRKKLGIDLSGQWSIRTAVGPLDLQTEQRGKKIKGRADLADVDLSSLLDLPIPLPIPVQVPPVTFKGKFKNLTLNLDFETQIDLPILGTSLFTVTGNITAHVDIATMSLVGHLTVNVNGNEVLSTDFTSPLPTLP